MASGEYSKLLANNIPPWIIHGGILFVIGNDTKKAFRSFIKKTAKSYLNQSGALGGSRTHAFSSGG